MKITALRHGETDGNVAQIVQSHTDGKLTGRGVEQAKAAATLLKDEAFDRIFCSNLGRCKETASHIVMYHENVPFIIDNRLIERSLGVYEGKSWGDVPSEAYDNELLDYRVQEGESWYDMRTRSVEFLNDLFSKFAEEHILLVTHGGNIRVIRSLLSDISLSESTTGVIDNAHPYSWSMTTPIKLKNMG